MGCSQSTQVPVVHKTVDHRLPFTASQVDEIQTFWLNVKRKFEDTARDMLLRFFRSYPYFQCMFPKLQNLEDENEMRLSEDFEAQAMMMFALFDDVVEALHDDLDPILDKLTDVARLHAKMEGFHSEFFKYMEDPFVDALQERFWEKFTDHEEELFRKLFKFVAENMSLEVEAIEYRLIPGD